MFVTLNLVGARPDPCICWHAAVQLLPSELVLLLITGI